MINLPVTDKYELQAIHKALMEAKFHPEPKEMLVQSSPMVAKFMNAVVDELEKINWVTDAEKKFKKIEYKNGWDEWRVNPSDYIVLPCIINHLEYIEQLKSNSEEELMEFMRVLLSPYKVDDQHIKELIEEAKKQNITISSS